jgi:hypothetical protein
MCNSSPATAVGMLHAMGDRIYDIQMVSNIFNKANAALFEETGVDTTATKARQLVDYIMHNPIVNGVILLHDPNSNNIGTRGKGRPNKARENKEIRMEEAGHKCVLSAEDYDEARPGALYLPDSDAMLLYCACCTDEELRMATVFSFFFTCDTTPMKNIEDISIMIVAGMTTKQQTAPFGRAFLSKECCWVFNFSWDVEFPLMYGYNVFIKVQQVTTDGGSQI